MAKLYKVRELRTINGKLVRSYGVRAISATELAGCKAGSIVTVWYRRGWNGRWDREESFIKESDGQWSVRTRCDYGKSEVLHKGDAWWRDVSLPKGLPQSYWAIPHCRNWPKYESGYFDEVEKISSLELEKLVAAVNYLWYLPHEVQLTRA